jgi:hypothetical protein
MITRIREMTYEETVEDIKNTCGRIPGVMKFMSRDQLVREWPLWKGLGEIHLERASCLLCTDSVFEMDF